MKVTRGELKKIINEELEQVIKEGWLDQALGFFGKMSDVDKQAMEVMVQNAGEFFSSEAWDDFAYTERSELKNLEAHQGDEEYADIFKNVHMGLYDVLHKTRRHLYDSGGTKAGIRALDAVKAPLQPLINALRTYEHRVRNGGSQRKHDADAEVIAKNNKVPQRLFQGFEEAVKASRRSASKRRDAEEQSKYSRTAIKNTREALGISLKRVIESGKIDTDRYPPGVPWKDLSHRDQAAVLECGRKCVRGSMSDGDVQWWAEKIPWEVAQEHYEERIRKSKSIGDAQ